MLLDSTILEVAISLVFVYCLLSLICTAASEFISRIFAMRSNNLAEGIRNLLNDPEADEKTKDLAQKIYAHPLISGLAKKGLIDNGLNWLAEKLKIKLSWGLPSYIPPRMFVIALLDVAAPSRENSNKSTALRDLVNKSEYINNKTRTALLALIDSSADNLEGAHKNIEDWFNATMERASGWYKRNIQTVVLVLALAIVLVANADTLMLANHFAQDSSLRATYVASAEKLSGSSIPTSNISVNDTVYAIEQLRIMPLDWTKEPCTPFKQSCGGDWLLKKMFGLIITVFALSLGAPFWFDILSKLINLRETGKKPSESEVPPEPVKLDAFLSRR